MKLSVIIVNYKSAVLTKSCLESLLKQPLPKDTELLVVDNDSQDDSVSLLRADFPEARVIASNKNIGMAGGVNIGIGQAHGQYYLILNPDIVVLPGAVDTLLAFMDEHLEVGLAAGKLVSPNGQLQPSCYRFYRWSTIVYRRTALGRTAHGRKEIDRFLMKDFDHAAVAEVDWLQGACLLARANAVEQVGCMDQRFFMYFEDVDWSRRFWQAGWRVTYVPNAEFSHYHQRGSELTSLFGLLTNRVARAHVTSALKYFWKYRGVQLPRLA